MRHESCVGRKTPGRDDSPWILHKIGLTNLSAARFRATGDLMDAHNAALKWRGVTDADYFHPAVIEANPQIFNSNWKP